MRVLIGALLFAIGLIGIPIGLVTLPAAAVRDAESGQSATEPDPAWAACGIRMECLQ